MQSPNAVIRFKLYNLLNSNFFSNQEKSLLIVFRYLCSEVSCLYISNAKLTNHEEISVSSFCLFTLLVVFSLTVPLSGDFASPAAEANQCSVFHG